MQVLDRLNEVRLPDHDIDIVRLVDGHHIPGKRRRGHTHMLPPARDSHVRSGTSLSSIMNSSPSMSIGELSLIKICRRSFVPSEELYDFLTRKRFRSNGNCRVSPSHANAIFAGRTTDASKRLGRVNSWVESLSRSG